ncbi:hypothetical protein EPN18_02385 [bacterium]|nr:MAG: hypothetical protein EPN18_02385 [bacterium]
MPDRKTGRKAKVIDMGRRGVAIAGKAVDLTARRTSAFYLNGNEYAFDDAEVIEVLPVSDIARVPNTPDFIVGVLSVRGEMIPVIDLKKRLDLALKSNAGGGQRIVIASAGGDLTAGFLIDGMAAVVEYGAGLKENAVYGEAGGGFVKATVRLSHRRVKILSAVSLLDIAKALKR